MTILAAGLGLPLIMLAYVVYTPVPPGMDTLDGSATQAVEQAGATVLAVALSLAGVFGLLLGAARLGEVYRFDLHRPVRGQRPRGPFRAARTERVVALAYGELGIGLALVGGGAGCLLLGLVVV
ncbi:hypothetical protein FHX42_005210 [Saccharopolyspora lacisalsi]|uniref:Uncharacterized protein n=1 Tax=Halosaccharopolyspora lacisalsi TaxID=1000566 RepID=A0A839E3D9_9PSEU|nr:hypothetical protein [Halosaccharopolyspora lacisalsi]